MSYILDALRKAEQERHLGQAPHPVTAPQSSTRPASQRRWLWLAIGLGLSSNGALLSYLLLRPQTPAPAIQPASAPSAVGTPTAPPAAEPAPATASVSQTPSPLVTPPVATQPLAPNNAAMAPLAESHPPVAIPPAMPPGKAVKPSPPAESVPLPPVATRSERPVTLAKAAPPSIVIGPEPPPLVDELPAGLRRGLPTSLDIHAYSPDVNKRFVVLNGQRFREGEPIGQGVVLEAVTPAGATLRRGEHRFRLLILR